MPETQFYQDVKFMAGRVKYGYLLHYRAVKHISVGSTQSRAYLNLEMLHNDPQQHQTRVIHTNVIYLSFPERDRVCLNNVFLLLYLR